MRKQKGFRSESDSMGSVQVPADALWGAQTQRALANFAISDLRMPPRFIHALALIKAAAARANGRLRQLPGAEAEAIAAAALEVASGRHDAQFPLDVFQTGSATSSHMNVNEVIAHLAGTALARPIDANDQVNRGQSSNDVVPSAIHLAASLALNEQLRPALRHLARTIERKARGLGKVIKTGRTHLMDAMPLSLAQELGAWASLLHAALARIDAADRDLRELPLGATAVGTGINAHPRFAVTAIPILARLSCRPLRPCADRFAALSFPGAALALSAQLAGLAAALGKISNDLRWMNSGPLSGLAEIRLPALQPGSSIMPGKVNPVIPEAVCMVAAQVQGLQQSIAIAAASGNFQLNVMLPLIAYDLLLMIGLLANAARRLADAAIAGLQVHRAAIARNLARNPVLVTALNPILGYTAAARIAKQAWTQGRPIIEVAHEATGMPLAELRRLLDPARLIEAREQT